MHRPRSDAGLLERLIGAVDPLVAGAAPDVDPASGQRRSAVLLLIDPQSAGLPLLFIRRSRLVSTHQGEIAFPGGRAEESDGSAAATALREAEEEVGIEAAAVEVIGGLPPVTTATSGRWLDPVVALRSGRLGLRPDGFEVAEYFWVRLTDLLGAPLTRRSVPGLSARPQVVFIEVGGRVIWGATGGIVASLLERLRAG